MKHQWLVSMIVAVALLPAILALPASGQGAREGKMRVLGRGTVEATM